MPLAEFETAILNVLDGQGGYTTGQIAERIDFQFGHNRRVHSAAVRTLLLRPGRDSLKIRHISA